MHENEFNHCNHFVHRKKRFCRMTIKPGEKYCGEHQPPSETKPETCDGKIRVVCPLDRNHTCYVHNLKKHLKICNARPKSPAAYIQKAVNIGEKSEDSDEHKLLSAFTTEEITTLISKINKIYEELLNDKVSDRTSSNNRTVEDEMLKPEYGDKSKKHLKQASAILGLLEENDLIQSNTCYVEFGAGRGQLTYWLAQIVDNLTNCHFLLIERSSPKHKRDNKLDKNEDNQVQRIRADIADLVLDQVDLITSTTSIVGLTKHLCGDATDLALRCLTNVTDQSKVVGCVMTFCCHHRCRWTGYTGKSFFNDIKLTKNDFDMMCGMSSWATCGTGFSRQRVTEGINNEVLNQRDKEIGLNREQKAEIGKKCKTILNWGRVKFLEDLGFKCNLYYYVSSEVSLENVCIIAKKKKSDEK